jgi:hypothetical protein
VPLGDFYLELVAVVDGDQAARSRFGRWVLGGGAEKPLRPLGWAVRPPDLDAAAARLGLRIDSGSRRTPQGRVLRWRVAGVEEAAASPTLPFFIEWERGTALPGRVGKQGTPALDLARLELRGDAGSLQNWLGDHRLRIALRAGPPGLESLVLENSTRQIVLKAD